MSEYSKLEKILIESAQKVRVLSKKSNVELLVAYKKVGDLLYTLIEHGAREPDVLTDSCSNRVSLTSNMVQSFHIVEDIISSGAYWSASAVLRQHMETLARIIEYREDNIIRDKKPPNVKVLPFNMAPNYGRLSELCHTSGGEVLGDFSGCAEGEGIATAIPAYREEWSKSLLSLHIAQMLTLAIEIYLLQVELYQKSDLPNIDKDIMEIAKILVETGFWKELT